MSSNNDATSQSDVSLSPGWQDFFPFEEAYPPQKEAAEETLETFDEDGFMLYEGPCGSGKTGYSLTTGLEKVRDPTTKFQKILVLTSVKQQTKAFEDDLETINNNLPENVSPVDGVTMVGKADLCSYNDAGRFNDSEVYGSCEDLRDTVKEALSNAQDENEKIGALKKMVGDKEGTKQSLSSDTLEGDDWSSPYKDEDPRKGADNQEYCPMYAKYREMMQTDTAPLTLNGLMRPDDLMKAASERGVCPYYTMTHLIEDAEVVIANYQHAFDEMTVSAITGDIIDDETILVCDEAHNTVRKVREQLGEDVSAQTIQFAINELENDVITQSNSTASSMLHQAFENYGLQFRSDTTEYKEFLQELKNLIENTLGEKALNDEHDSWEKEMAQLPNRIDENHNDDLPDEIVWKLRNPNIVEEDRLTKWAKAKGYEDIWKKADAIGQAIARAFEEAEEEDQSFTKLETWNDSVGRVLGSWEKNDHEQYFRKVVLEKRNNYRRPYNPDDQDLPLWNQHYKASLTLENCIPSEEISETFSEFGAGILMSATLEPIDVFEQEVGFDTLDDRRVDKLVHDLRFPEENRYSCVANVPAFTGSNRGKLYMQERRSGDYIYDKYLDDEGVETREQYLEVISSVINNTDGNVLIGMPSYSEAKWVKTELDDGTNRERSDLRNRLGGYNINKDIRADESSSVEETDRLKDWFFRGDGKVLVTSLRGTLTEGVDYDGDRLDAAVICGIPIRALGGPYPDAIRNAYDHRFGDPFDNDDSTGFNFAFSVPAIRKARQALGRVIRGADDVGVRVLADNRYLYGDSYDGYGGRVFLPNYAQKEFTKTDPSAIGRQVARFWRDQ